MSKEYKKIQIAQVDYDTLKKLDPEALAILRKAYVGPEAYGAVAVVNIPKYKECRMAAFQAGIKLALTDGAGRERAAAVSNTYPGWSGTPGSESHPLQSSFLYNVKEEVNGRVDPYFGKNVFPNEAFHQAFGNLARPMHQAALDVLCGCDMVMEEVMTEQGLVWSKDGRSLSRLGETGPVLAGRFICYDSGFTRLDPLLAQKDVGRDDAVSESTAPGSPAGAEACGGAEPCNGKEAGHAADELASMRTHTTPVKTVGHAGDNLASMRTHNTPVKTVGLTPVKNAGHAGDGLASMRTHNTPVKTVGLTPVKNAGHADDGLASMRTHNTPVKTVGLSNGNVAEKHADGEFGDYWLPWHIDSNYITLIHKDMYANEKDGSLAERPKNAGALMMNKEGDVGFPDVPDDALIVMMGGFAQIYSGGVMGACRHGVVNPLPEGVARFNYCNFWYVPWHTPCSVPPGREKFAVNTGWNAMMDSSYVDITMKQGFAAFRSFMTSPEARVQFQDSERFKELNRIVTLPAEGKTCGLRRDCDLVVDLLTDIRCPFSYIALLNLRKALQNLSLLDRFFFRFHPVFLNPSVPKEGEELDEYLLRDHGITKEQARAEDYPLRVLGLAAGVSLNPDRRVVNTFDAFCLLELADRQGFHCELFEELSRRYFEGAEDISDPDVLEKAALVVKMDLGAAGKFKELLADKELRELVQSRYDGLATYVDSVPHFLLRERSVGLGIEAGGNRLPAEWEEVLKTLLKKKDFVGMSVHGHGDREVWLASANPSSPVSLSGAAQRGWHPKTSPFSADDFVRADESDDAIHYKDARISVQHLDESSLLSLTAAYRSFFEPALAACGDDKLSVLDLCSSWTSHFPPDILKTSRVVAHGINAEELKANAWATETHVQDLNQDPALPWSDSEFDFVTNALSIQYMTKPLALSAEVHRVLKPGGVVLIAFSHRSFFEKCVGVWAKEPYDGEGHALLIREFLLDGRPERWSHLWSADISPPHGDPMWVVGAVKKAGSVRAESLKTKPASVISGKEGVRRGCCWA